MIIIKNFKQFLLNTIEGKRYPKYPARVIEVTIKDYYVIPEGDSITNEQIKQEWFVDFENRHHAYKDGSKVGGAQKVIDIKFMTKEDIEELD